MGFAKRRAGIFHNFVSLFVSAGSKVALNIIIHVQEIPVSLHYDG